MMTKYLEEAYQLHECLEMWSTTSSFLLEKNSTISLTTSRSIEKIPKWLYDRIVDRKHFPMTTIMMELNPPIKLLFLMQKRLARLTWYYL